MYTYDTIDKWQAAEHLYKAIAESPLDLNVECWLSNAIDAGLTQGEVLLACDGFFRRSYGRDILFPEWKEDPAGRPYLQLHLSRSGICDQLPEGVLYGQRSQNAIRRTSDMAADCTANRKTEKLLRVFFQPLENQFIWQRAYLFREEQRLLTGRDIGLMDDMPGSMQAAMTGLFPYVHRIAGEPDLMAGCLEKILNEKVRVRLLAPERLCPADDTLVGLGNQRLAIETVCDGEFSEPCPLLEFVIGPLVHSSLSEYLEGGERERLLTCFFEFFAPVEADIRTTIAVDPSAKICLLGEGVLGFEFI
jgi:hypothetical protein